MNERIKYDYWWASIPKNYTGRVKMAALSAGSTEKLYEMEKEELINIEGIGEKYAEDIINHRKDWNIDGEWEDFKKSGIRFIPWYADDFPKRLKGISGHPFALFVYGDLPDDDVPSVAVVGARNCSEYGRMNARRFGADLAGYGVQIVSGMAYGIDGVSQEEAINAGGRSFAVLGCGVNICYPASNRNLYERLKKNGGVLSEYGIYTKPLPNLFPPRNRIISGLSDVVLVVEAREKSGTMITVDTALEQGRDVAIIPGRISDPLSTGCINLWKQGAYPVSCAEDIMYLLDEEFDNKRKKHVPQRIVLDPGEKKVYDILEPYAKSIGQICDDLGFELRRVIEILVSLTIKGLAAETSKGYYVRIKDCLAVAPHTGL